MNWWYKSLSVTAHKSKRQDYHKSPLVFIGVSKFLFHFFLLLLPLLLLRIGSSNQASGSNASVKPADFIAWLKCQMWWSQIGKNPAGPVQEEHFPVQQLELDTDHLWGGAEALAIASQLEIPSLGEHAEEAPDTEMKLLWNNRKFQRISKIPKIPKRLRASKKKKT